MGDGKGGVSPSESPLQGSSRVAPIRGWVRIVPESRFSGAMSKYSSPTATLSFQTVSKSAEGTTSGFVAAGPDRCQRAAVVPPAPPRAEDKADGGQDSRNRIQAGAPRRRETP